MTLKENQNKTKRKNLIVEVATEWKELNLRETSSWVEPEEPEKIIHNTNSCSKILGDYCYRYKMFIFQDTKRKFLFY